MKSTHELHLGMPRLFMGLFTRPDGVTIYTRAVTIMGLAILIHALHHMPRLSDGLWLFILLGVISELTSTHLFASSRSTVSISSIVAIASIAVFGPLAGVFTYAASGLTTGLTTTFHSRNSANVRASIWKRITFNVGMWITAGFIAGQVFMLMGGSPGNTGYIANTIALAGATLAEWFVNAVILIGVIWLQTGRSPVAIWRRDICWQAPVSISGGVLGGGVLALAYEMLEIYGILIVLLPILATGYAFRLYKNNMNEYVEGLEKVNRELKDAMSTVEQANAELTDANQAVLRLNAELFQSLARVFDMRDPYVGGHAAQVAAYAVEIAVQMGLAPERIEQVRQSAYLHDIGKLAIPEAILHKPGPLTDIEYEFIKKHTDIGADLLESTEGLRHLAPYVRHHHERWDGGGYPIGLTGEEIPLESRILCVCDAVETMASDRPYHRGMSTDAIIAEIRRCAGTQFDPRVTEALIQLVLERPGLVVNSARSVRQQFAAGLLADASLTHGMFAWVLQNGGPDELVEANGFDAADHRNLIFPRNRPSADPRLA